MFFIEFFLQQQNNVNNQSLNTIYIPGLERESAKSVIGITEVLDFWREKQYGLHILQMEVILRMIDSGVNRIFFLCIFTGIDVVFQWLVQAGKLCVILPEMKILEAYVRKLERWQERAKIVVECTMSLQVSEL